VSRGIGGGKKKSESRNQRLEIRKAKLETRRERPASEGEPYTEKDEEDRQECLSYWAALALGGEFIEGGVGRGFDDGAFGGLGLFFEGLDEAAESKIHGDGGNDGGGQDARVH